MSVAAVRAPVPSTSGSQPVPIRVAVMESDPLRFVGLRSLLEEEATLSLHAISLEDLALAGTAPGVILVGDAQKPVLITTIARVRAACPAVPILAAGAGLRDPEIVQVLARGAKGYVDHSCSPEEFARALRAVHAGGVWASRRVLSQFIDRVADLPCGHISGQPAFSPDELHVLEAAAGSASGTAQPALSALVARLSSANCSILGPAGEAFTTRESDVLRMLVAGHSNKEIGAELGIEERTVKAHVAKLMRKVGVENRVALSVHAIKQGLLPA